MITDTHYSHTKAFVCIACDKNAQEGGDAFTLKGIQAHFAAYGHEHGGFKTVELENEYLATNGGPIDGPGTAHGTHGIQWPQDGAKQ